MGKVAKLYEEWMQGPVFYAEVDAARLPALVAEPEEFLRELGVEAREGKIQLVMSLGSVAERAVVVRMIGVQNDVSEKVWILVLPIDE